MPALERFDLDPTKTVSDAEIERRWTEFRRASASNPLRRRAQSLLSEESARARLARRALAPLTSRRRRRRLSNVGQRALGATTFPSNYNANGVAASRDAVANPRRHDVLVVVIDEFSTSPDYLVDTLNETLSSTSAVWLMLLDARHDAYARDEALDVLVAAARDEDDVVFADEPGPDPSTPVLKPRTVGPHTLMSYNVVGRPALLRVSTMRAIEGFNLNVAWAFEHDAYLRLQERGAVFHHVARVLRAGRTPDAFHPSRSDEGTLAATSAALVRRQWRGRVDIGAVAGVSRWSVDPPSPAPSIDIIIPTRDRVELLRTCIESVERRTTYPNYRIIILDNDSREPETLRYFATSPHQVVACPGPFNYAKIVNRGVHHASGEFVVTLNNDTVVLTPSWLEQMVGLAALRDVGVVGVSLIEPDGRHEHDGFVIAPYPQHLRAGVNYYANDQFINSVRDVCAVTGAVQMIERAWWQSLHGMDEELRVVMNDVDLCLRSELEGRHVVFTPDVELVHAAGSSRGDLDPLTDRNRFIRRWDIFGTFRDPYLPESLELRGEHFHYREPS